MKPIFRFGAAALTASVLLSGSLNSQEAPEEAEPPPPVLVEYDMHGLTQAGLETARVPGAVGDLLAPDRTFGPQLDRELYQWSLRESGREACCWDNADEVMEHLASFCSFDDSWEIRNLDAGTNRSALLAPAEMHQRVRWALAALKNIASVKINLRVHKLAAAAGVDQPNLGKSQVAELTRNARLVGMANTGLGDPVVLQQTGSTSFVADYEANAATGAGGHSPITGTLVTGDEFVAGAIVLADGRVWVQGWHAASTLQSMRKQTTVAGDVELPTSTYTYTPVSAVIENGGATLIDAGASGRFMVTVTASGPVASAVMDCGQGRDLRLLNVTGALRGHALGARWMMTPNTQEAMHDSVLRQIMIEEYVDGPYNDAAMFMADRAQEFNANREVSVMGPLLAVKSWALEDDAETLAERARMDASIAASCRVHDSVALRVRAVRVPAASALNAGLLGGSPTEADIVELSAMAGRVNVTDRLLCAGMDQNMDVLDTRIASHVHGYNTSTATEIVVHDPEVRSLLLGSQLRWVAREAVDGAVALEVRAGVTVGPEGFEPMQVTLAGKSFFAERSRSNLVQARFNGELKPGQSMSHIVPASGTQDELLVFVVSRLK